MASHIFMAICYLRLSKPSLLFHFSHYGVDIIQGARSSVIALIAAGWLL